MRQDKDKRIQILQEEVVIPKIVQKKAEAALNVIRSQAENAADPNSTIHQKTAVHLSARRTSRKFLAVGAAAALVAGCVSVGAAVYKNWSRSLEEGLRVTEEQKTKLEDNHTSSVVDQSQAVQGVTVTATQTIVDSYYAHLAFKIQGFDLPEGEEPGFENISVTVDGISDMDYSEDITQNFSWGGQFYNGLVPGEDGKVVYADGTSIDSDGVIVPKYQAEDGSLEFQLTLANSRNKGFFIDKPIHVELKNLGTMEKAQFAPAVDGTWSFDWTLGGSDNVKEYQLNVPLEGTNATVTQAEISPISLKVLYQFPREEIVETYQTEDGTEETFTMYAEPPFPVGVKLKDGTLLPYLYLGPGSSSYTSEEGDEYVCAFAIDRILDVDQVEALLLRKTPAEEGQIPTEDNFYVVPLDLE